MNDICHEDVKIEIFSKYPKVKEEYDKLMLNDLISREIKSVRNRKRITQLQLAKKADTTQSVIARIESGNQNISMRTLQKLLFALDATLKIEMK